MAKKIALTDKGDRYWQVLVDGVQVSQHSQRKESVEAATNAQLACPECLVEIVRNERVHLTMEGVEEEEPAPEPEPEPEPPPEEEPPVEEEPTDPPEEEPMDPEPTPGVNLILHKDFAAMTQAQFDAEFAAQEDWFEEHQIERMSIDDVGLKMPYPAMPGNCTNWSMGVALKLPGEVREFCFVATLRFEPHFDTKNLATSCSSNPDLKLWMGRVRNFGGGTSKASRFGLLVGNSDARNIEYHTPGGPENNADIEIFDGEDCRQVLWTGEDVVIACYGRVSSAQDVPDGAGGFWLRSELLEWGGGTSYRDGIVVNRRGVYGFWLGNTINQGPSQEQAYWWRDVKVYDGLPSWLPTS